MMRFVFCFLATFCFVSPIHAGMVIVTDTQSTSDVFLFTGNGAGSLSSGGDLTFSIPQFDLGFSLQSVEVQYEVLSFSLQMSLTNLSSSETASFIGGNGESRSGPLFPGILIFPISNAQFGVLSLGPGESRNYTGAITNPFTTLIGPMFLADYTGSGVITTGPAFSRSLSVSDLSGLTNPDDLLAQGLASATVRATITYTFDETAVPEPSTFTLLGIGGIALAGYGWRRKRRQAA